MVNYENISEFEQGEILEQALTEEEEVFLLTRSDAQIIRAEKIRIEEIFPPMEPLKTRIEKLGFSVEKNLLGWSVFKR